MEFAYSTGGEDGLGAFLLEAIRPNKWQTFDVYQVFGGDCYNAIIFITWYMDKNRPLPPNPEFDYFRDEDFERRKAEGFPKPLYPIEYKHQKQHQSSKPSVNVLGGGRK